MSAAIKRGDAAPLQCMCNNCCIARMPKTGCRVDPSPEVEDLRKEARQWEKYACAAEILLGCYRTGNHRRAGAAIDNIREAKERLAKLGVGPLA